MDDDQLLSAWGPDILMALERQSNVNVKVGFVIRRAARMPRQIQASC
jgi:hypothetical protein